MSQENQRTVVERVGIRWPSMARRTVRSVIVLTRRITWFSRQGFTNAGQHHHAWIFFDFAEPPRPRPELIFAHGPGGQRGGMPDLGQEELPLLDTADDAID